MHRQWKTPLGIDAEGGEVGGESAAARQLEAAVGLYLRKMSSKHDVSSIMQVRIADMADLPILSSIWGNCKLLLAL